MKKIIRFVFPVILALAIILCSIWYLFVYDREFTRDVLLSFARNLESRGNHEGASAFYDLAYSHSGDDEAVAIELANQYKNTGNYTKAEYTLTNAIADGGGIDLYIALCKTYVEQDKLLDAVTMLNNVASPEIRQQLEELRPEMPQITPDPGFYSQYIPVNVLSSSGTLYVTADGKYPSLEDSPYQAPITLQEGENTINALCIDDNGLISKLATFGYIVGGVIEEVTFSDPAFEAAVRELLSIDAKDPVYTNSLWSILDFTLPAGCASYADLKYLPYLESLTVDNGIPSEIKHIASLSSLSTLRISNCTVSTEDLAKIAALPLLKNLSLQNCGISSITELSAAKNLLTLDLQNNAIRNLSPIASMTKLQELNLSHNAITDIAILTNIPALTKLDVSFNTLTTIAPITANSALTWLDASNNRITDIGKLEQLTNLTYLSLAKNAITDISAAANCTKLTELDLGSNQLTDISSLRTLEALRYLNFSNNQITALPEFAANCALVIIDGSHNLLESIDPLGVLKSLNNVNMDYNEKLESIEALVKCPVLIEVNVYGTKVTEVESLTSQSVIVNYNPVQEN